MNVAEGYGPPGVCGAVSVAGVQCVSPAVLYFQWRGSEDVSGACVEHVEDVDENLVEWIRQY